jgi:flavin-dependent dehydrogenase
VHTDLLIGADGRNSTVAQEVGARTLSSGTHATATIYGYWEGLAADDYEWHFRGGLGAGLIPTNDGHTLVYAGLSRERFRTERERGLEAVLMDVVRGASSELLPRIASAGATPKLRAFAGAPGFIRESAGPGWALVGDAGYFKDPLTAHGITDALRDAELLARAVIEGRGGSLTLDDAVAGYAERRDALSHGLMSVTDRVASLSWTTDELMELHRSLSREMKKEVEEIRSWDRLLTAA